MNIDTRTQGVVVATYYSTLIAARKAQEEKNKAQKNNSDDIADTVRQSEEGSSTVERVEPILLSRYDSFCNTLKEPVSREYAAAQYRKSMKEKMKE